MSRAHHHDAIKETRRFRPFFMLLAAAMLSLHTHGLCQPDTVALANSILGDQRLAQSLALARGTMTGLNAGTGYGEVWIRDLNTFLELYLQNVNSQQTIKDALKNFVRFQGADGNVPDGYINTVTHKNDVETDQEASLIQAVWKYIRVTGDTGFLADTAAGKTMLQGLELALGFLYAKRWDTAHALIWGATTADWGDVQPETYPGTNLNSSTHRAIDIYDNAMLAIAISNYLTFVKSDTAKTALWTSRAAGIAGKVAEHLWDATNRKYFPHVYLAGSPWQVGFNENAIYYHGGTTIAIEAGLLSPAERDYAFSRMIANRMALPAPSVGLTLYPCYPAGSFRDPIMDALNEYQNGGDWPWFGGRTIQEMIGAGRVDLAYQEIIPIVALSNRDRQYYEWYTPAGAARGSGTFRGGAGVVGKAILMLQSWARNVLAAVAGNIAPRAAVTVSSSYNYLYKAANATDCITGIADTGEWASRAQANPWIQLAWQSAQSVDSIVLFDRSKTNENANGGTLTFSDGTSITVSAIPANGSAKSVSFPAKTVTWVRFQVAGGSGANVGLSEIRVFGEPAMVSIAGGPPARFAAGSVPAARTLFPAAGSPLRIPAGQGGKPLSVAIYSLSGKLLGKQIAGCGRVSGALMPPGVYLVQLTRAR